MDFWVLVANPRHATIYGRDVGGARLHVLWHADRADAHHADPEGAVEMWSAYHAHMFARRLADHLREGRTAHRYRELILVGDPSFLSMVRDALDYATARTVIGEIPRDLREPETDPATEHLIDVMLG